MPDRVAADGRLAPWRPETGIDQSFPPGGHLTCRLLRGDPRKIVLARSGVEVASGDHRAPGYKPGPRALACVNHFKWRSGVAMNCGAASKNSPRVPGPGKPQPSGTRPAVSCGISSATTGASTSATPGSPSGTSSPAACPAAGPLRPPGS